MNADRDRSEQPVDLLAARVARREQGRLADADPPPSAPEPSQAATEAHSDENDRHGYSQPTRAQYDALQGEVEVLRSRYADARAALLNMDRLVTEANEAAEKAEAKVARVEALANHGPVYEGASETDPYYVLLEDLRAALAGPAEPETTEGSGDRG